MTRVVVAFLLGACGPTATGESRGNEEGASDSSSGSRETTGEGGSSEASGDASSGDSSGSSGDRTVLAWLRPDETLELTIVNHDAATCADPSATPPFDTSPCDLPQDLWQIDLTLEAPYEVPGWFETSDPAPGPTEGSNLRGSFSGTTAGSCGWGYGVGIDATLALDVLSDVAIAGTVTFEEPAWPDGPFSVDLCPS